MGWDSFAKGLVGVQRDRDKQALEGGYAVTPEAVEELKNAIRYIEAYRNDFSEKQQEQESVEKKLHDAYGTLEKYSKGYGGTRIWGLPNLGKILNTRPGNFEKRIKGKWHSVGDEQETFDHNPKDFVEAKRRLDFLRQRPEKAGRGQLQEAMEEYEALGGDEEYEKNLEKMPKNWRDGRFFELSPEQQRRYYREDQNNQGAFNRYMSGINPMV
tara:strand:+ start:162 stop:800 length:639 start_codon:yes stop_codon:yes gene_type:complete